MNDLRLRPDITLGQAQEELARAFAAAGLEDHRREARLLLTRALGLDLAGFFRRESQLLGGDAAGLAAMAERRLAREPLSRILGERGFFGLDFAISPAVLDPRPETEGLVEAVLEHAAARGRAAARLRLLDLGTGSGAILIALLRQLPQAEGQGVDLSAEALAVAAVNADLLGVAERARFVFGDLFTPLSGQFDIIVSNPPYIPSAEIAGLMPEVRLHDPIMALDGGSDGLAFYRRIAVATPARLAPDGLLALEIGQGQHESVPAILVEAGLAMVALRTDAAGIPRVVLARPAATMP